MNLHVATADRTLLPRGLIKRPRSAAELRIVDACRRLVEASNEAHDDATGIELAGEVDVLRGRIANMMPSTAELAILQLAMAVGELDRFDAGWIADEQGKDALREIQKLATSVLGFVERETGVMREDIGAEYFAGFRVEN
ncbi:MULTISPECIES: hypothetical protein [Rhizobium]|jgi:hypothetical protein|uniref:hypothetical protein n=1 Tax=Rhizobium TaxID=379 RepID=UPI000522F3E9|nr:MULTISPECIES: hypothetical protein [Rhizobium]KPN23686.1 hypothetical protein KS05_23865 [Rhizobium brockwellii]QJX06173.1 hypothetical protein RLCC275e_14860 [Rhizobium brockwellii]TAY89024.1 hypothetical protein ELH83_15095 [Rhizobium leguminosarum]